MQNFRIKNSHFQLTIIKTLCPVRYAAEIRAINNFDCEKQWHFKYLVTSWTKYTSSALSMVKPLLTDSAIISVFYDWIMLIT